jgi:hypothetical protein
MLTGWDVGILPKEEELLLGLREELIPEMNGYYGCTSTEYAHKMILQGLDGLFSHVAAVIIGGNKLVCYVGDLDGCNVRC